MTVHSLDEYKAIYAGTNLGDLPFLTPALLTHSVVLTSFVADPPEPDERKTLQTDITKLVRNATNPPLKSSVHADERIAVEYGAPVRLYSIASAARVAVRVIPNLETALLPTFAASFADLYSTTRKDLRKQFLTGSTRGRFLPLATPENGTIDQLLGYARERLEPVFDTQLAAHVHEAHTALFTGDTALFEREMAYVPLLNGQLARP